MKAVVFYESADDLAEKAPLHAGPHRARWRDRSGRAAAADRVGLHMCPTRRAIARADAAARR